MTPEARAKPRPARVLVPLGFLALLLCRRPASLLHADFWAEDGWRWYPDAYNQGWHSLVAPYAGYLQTICRLVALAAQPLPLAWAPTLFALSALCVQATAASLLVSRRLDRAWPDRASRVLFACIAVLLPNAFEVYANLTNAQWNLSLVGFLLLTAEPSRTAAGRLLDRGALLLCGLSGPFCLFLLPVALWQAARARRSGAGAPAVNLALTGLCCVVQASLALAAGRGGGPDLGATFARLVDILALQVILAPLIGRHGMTALLHGWPWRSQLLPIGATMLGGALGAMALASGGRLLRQFCLYASLLLAASLLRPATGSTEPAWRLFLSPDIGDRYYVVPMLAWIGVLFTAAARAGRTRLLASGLIAMVTLSIPGDLHFATALATAPPTRFDGAAKAFDHAPAGTVMAFPIHPEGASPMLLTKR